MSVDWNALLAAAKGAQKNAYAPYSKYHVGCALLATDGRVFVGANCENASFPLGNCAERAAMGAAVTAGVRAFAACVIVTQGPGAGSPCGGCRQVLCELGPTFPVRCVALTGETVDFDRDALLPGAFGPGQPGAMTDVRAPIPLVIRGGTVITMDPDRRVVNADVLSIGGTIVAIGVVDADGARVLDARGRMVIPGFVQAHVHLCQALFRGMADDLPLLEWLKTRIWPLEAAHDEASLAASARLGLAEMILAGTTTILDMGTVNHHDVVFDAMEASGIRGLSGKAMMDAGEGVPRGLRETTKGSLRESERLAKAWHDKAGRLGYAYAPRFVLSCSEKLFRGAVERVEATPGTLLHTHAAEHAEERVAAKRILGMDDVAALAWVGVKGPRAVLAHGVQLRPDEMKAMARAGTRVVHCPSANLKLASGIADVVAMREAGIVVGLGADGAPCNNRMDPFTEVREAALLAKVVRKDAAAMTATDALALATIDGARALGLDSVTGSLEVGKRADLVVVDVDAPHTLPAGDPAARIVYACTPSDVRHVVCDGRVLVSDRDLVGVDLDALRVEARAQASLLRKRAEI